MSFLEKREGRDRPFLRLDVQRGRRERTLLFQSEKKGVTRKGCSTKKRNVAPFIQRKEEPRESRERSLCLSCRLGKEKEVLSERGESCPKREDSINCREARKKKGGDCGAASPRWKKNGGGSLIEDGLLQRRERGKEGGRSTRSRSRRGFEGRGCRLLYEGRREGYIASKKKGRLRIQGTGSLFPCRAIRAKKKGKVARLLFCESEKEGEGGGKSEEHVEGGGLRRDAVAELTKRGERGGAPERSVLRGGREKGNRAR